MPFDELLLFLTLTFFVSASPGPVMLAAMANGATHGVRHALWGMAGATAGNLLLILLSLAGMALVLKSSDTLFRAVQWVGAAYLIWLGAKVCLQPTAGGFTDGAATGVAGWSLFIKSVGIAISNPKGLIYFGALFPQFIAPERALGSQVALLTSLFVIMDFAWMLVYAKGGSVVVGWLGSPRHRRWFNFATGGALMGAGILMVVVQ